MRHIIYITYGTICSLPYLAFLGNSIDIRYVLVLLPLLVTSYYLSLIMLRYKQVAIFYFLNVASGFTLYNFGYTLELSGFNDVAYILGAIIVQFIIFAAGYFVASMCDEL